MEYFHVVYLNRGYLDANFNLFLKKIIFMENKLTKYINFSHKYRIVGECFIFFLKCLDGCGEIKQIFGCKMKFKVRKGPEL